MIDQSIQLHFSQKLFLLLVQSLQDHDFFIALVNHSVLLSRSDKILNIYLKKQSGYTWGLNGRLLGFFVATQSLVFLQSLVLVAALISLGYGDQVSTVYHLLL